MKIQIIQSIAGHAEPMYELADFSFAPGSIIEVQDVLGAAWIESGVAIAAKKGDKVTMPAEAFTYRKPLVIESIDYEKAALFLRSRGYLTATPEAAKTFVDDLKEKYRPGFLKELSEFKPAAPPVTEPVLAEPEIPVTE